MRLYSLTIKTLMECSYLYEKSYLNALLTIQLSFYMFVNKFINYEETYFDLLFGLKRKSYVDDFTNIP